MAERTHLSIGEVLSLLREEFPDVTISKIRFLESQGLVDPERTPSGYRKFYDHDVERLRWILRQQRENFLPLKVIRGRLSEAPGDLTEAGAPEPPLAGASPETSPADAGRGPSPSVAAAGDPLGSIPDPAVGQSFQGRFRPGGHPSGAAQSRSDSAGATAPFDEATASGSTPGEAGPPRPVSSPAPPPPPPPSPVRRSGRGDERGPAPVEPPAGREPILAGAPAPSARTTTPAADLPPGRARTPSLFAGLHRAEPDDGPSGPGRPEVAAPADGPAPAPGAQAADAADDDPETYTVDELAAAAGAAVELVNELKQYGLIAPQAVVAGIAYFDGGALAVARAAAGFARHGVEARHLRIWRNAADREADLFQQLVLPLLRQRNPQARRQALDTLSELAAAGAALRSALVGRAIREIR